MVNWNTREELRACLRSLEKNRAAVETRVVVVDNASNDGSADMVRTEFPDVLLLAETVNHGYAKGNDLGLARVEDADAVLLLNPDTEVPEGTLDAALDALRADPGRGVVSVRFVGLDGATQPSVRGFPEYRDLAKEMLGLRDNGYRLPSFDYAADGPAPQPMGTFLLFRREALDAVGGRFDESFPIFFNEVDLLRRMADEGFHAWYLGSAWIRHVGGAGTRQVKRSMIWESHRSLVRYMAKHRRRGWEWGPWLLLAVFSPLVAFVRAKGYDPGFRTQHHDL